MGRRVEGEATVGMTTCISFPLVMPNLDPPLSALLSQPLSVDADRIPLDSYRPTCARSADFGQPQIVSAFSLLPIDQPDGSWSLKACRARNESWSATGFNHHYSGRQEV